MRLTNIAFCDYASAVHPLKTWLAGERLTDQEFAERVNTTGPYLNQIVNGHRHPSRDLAKAISQATDGAITVEQMMVYERPADVPESPEVA